MAQILLKKGLQPRNPPAGYISTFIGMDGVFKMLNEFGVVQSSIGVAGRGIVSIVRTSGTGAAGTTDTYTITYTDATTTTFTVVNGADGRAITSIARTAGTGLAGSTDTYTITYSDSTTSTFTVVNGTNGTNGRGITSIIRTSGTGLAGSTDTYTITFTDATTTTFTVVNGTNGTNGASGAIGWVTKTANYTAAASDAIRANTTGGAFTLTLPAAPADNDFVYFKDYAGTFGTNKLTIARNGKNIMGLAQDMDVTTSNFSGGLTFISTTNDWRF